MKNIVLSLRRELSILRLHCNKKRRSKDILNCYQLLNKSSTDERGKRDIQVPKPNVGNMISEGYSGQRPHIFGHT